LKMAALVSSIIVFKTLRHGGIYCFKFRVGHLASIIRLGAIPAFFLTVAADKYGRRTMLLFTILPYTVSLYSVAVHDPSFIALLGVSVKFPGVHSMHCCSSNHVLLRSMPILRKTIYPGRIPCVGGGHCGRI
jgi:hypothetical protein